MNAPAPGASRVQRSLLSWTAGMGSTFALALAGFLATPYLLQWLGKSRFGAWEVIGEWMGYVGLTQLALGPAALSILMLRAHAQQDEPAFLAVARWGLKTYLRGCLLAMPLVGVAVWVAPRWAHLGAASALEVRWAVALSGLGGLALEPAIAVFRSMLETRQRGYWVRGAMTVQGIVIIALSLLWAHAGWGLRGMAAANLIGIALGTAGCAFACRHWLRAWQRTPPARIEGRLAWQLSWPVLAATLGNQVNLFTDNTVVLVALSPAAVASFYFTQRVVQFAGGQVNAIGNVSWAALGELRASSPGRFQERVVELASTVAGLGVLVGGTVAAFNRNFVLLWVGAAQYAGSALTLFTAAAVAVFGYVCFFGSLIDTQGDTRQRLGVSTLGSALNLALSLVLARRWGLAGVALGTLIAYLATDAWYMPYLAVRHYGVPAVPLARASAAAVSRGLLFALAVWGVAHLLPLTAHWWVLLPEMSLAGAAAAFYGWTLILRPPDRAAWRARWSASISGLRA